jgi:hypothetical protein
MLSHGANSIQRPLQQGIQLLLELVADLGIIHVMLVFSM